LVVCLLAVDRKRKCPKEGDIKLYELKFIWGLHQKICEEHTRSDSFLLKYKSSITSYVARPSTVASTIVIDLDQDPLSTSSGSGELAVVPFYSLESYVPLSAAMGKRKFPNLLRDDVAAGTHKLSMEEPKRRMMLGRSPQEMIHS